MNKKMLVVISFLAVFTLLELFVLYKKPPQMAEAWLSDVAYNLNPEFTGSMGRDIPWGELWSSGTGKLFFLGHHLVYRIFGVGPFQARSLSFFAGWLLLVLVYRWSRKFFSAEAALLSAALVAVSPSWWVFMADGRQDMLHCLAYFLSFYFMSSGAISRKNAYFFTGAFFAAISVDINYRGIEIVICALLFVISLPDRKALTKRLVMFFAGSAVAFVIWSLLNVVPMGLANFIHHSFMPALSGEGAYSAGTLLSEAVRFIRYSDIGSGFTKIEIAYWILLLVVFYRYRSYYSLPAGMMLRWIGIMFIVMSVVERATYPVYALLYSPFICIYCGVALHELFKSRKKIAWCALVAILIYGLAGYGARAGRYYYHEYIKKDYLPAEFYKKLRSAVDTNKGIIGDITNWYAFKDTSYYCGMLYFDRLQNILEEFSGPESYKNDRDRAAALMGVLKRRGIEYVIASGSMKDYMSEYFNGNLPGKNFELVASAEDYFLGEDSAEHPVKTEVYRIVSYEP